MTLISQQQSFDSVLSIEAVLQTLHQGLERQFRDQRVLVLIPDHTRTLPLPILFRSLVEILHNVRQLDFMVALGTHPPLSDERLNRLLGITAQERSDLGSGAGLTKWGKSAPLRRNPPVNLLNHAWNDHKALATIGIITQDQIKQIAAESWHLSLGGDVPVRVARAVFDYDHLLILGPTFPHAVAGFSGGAKYLFPGISGPEMINTTHWLGALTGVVGTIGIKETPVRRMIHAATEKLTIPITLIALVVVDDHIAGIFIGDYRQAWSAAADLSAKRHIKWVEQPFRRALSWAPPMYDELWTAAKAMYKLEPAVEVGGEVVIFAPHLDRISHVHGKYIYEVGYHIMDYLLENWARINHIPLGVLAHSTHLRGSGVMDIGIEKPNVRVTLASKIPPEICDHLNLGYLDPDSIDVEDWKNREAERILFVPKAGEILYRVGLK
jgi:nickel-dependent lactate racemase